MNHAPKVIIPPVLHFAIFYSIDITDNAALILEVQLTPQSVGSVTYYIPVVLIDVDNEVEAQEG